VKKIFIVAAKRTPQGRFMGTLAKRSSVELAKFAGAELLKIISPDAINQTIIGSVLTAGTGMNIARQIAVALNIPLDRSAYTVNMMCASGMQSVILGVQAILSEQANAVLCGGTESMSNAPYLLDRARAGYKLGDGVLIDSLLRDGLVDTFSQQHMGLTVEGLAEKFKVNRSEQDAFAYQSQQKYASAHSKGLFNHEMIPVDDLKQDEHPRPDVALEKLSTMKPAFKAGGTITAGNSSGINDGAALLVIADEQAMQKNDWKPIARITGWSAVGCEPGMMGLGPVYATKKLCQSFNISLDSFDAVELNEAFAAQSLACIRELKLKEDRVNPNGGAIALGHPIGASWFTSLIKFQEAILRGDWRLFASEGEWDSPFLWKNNVSYRINDTLMLCQS
jgi:acetyl-CoA C-acetyltransferase